NRERRMRVPNAASSPLREAETFGDVANSAGASPNDTTLRPTRTTVYATTRQLGCSARATEPSVVGMALKNALEVTVTVHLAIRSPSAAPPSAISVLSVS